MAAMERTRWPGIYKRGDKYAYTWRDRLGKQRWGSARTVDLARREKARREREATDRVGADDAVLLAVYLREWVERYQGTGRRGFREETRGEYRAALESHVIPFFGDRARLSQVQPRDVANFVGRLVKTRSRQGGTLSDSRIANILAPLKAAMKTARAEGLIADDPTRDVPLPHRARIEEDAEKARPFSLEQLPLVVGLIHPSHRLAMHVLAMTGLRASEFIGLEVRHLVLDGSSPHVAVRQRLRYSQTYREGEMGALKSRHARRDVPLGFELVGPLRELVRGRPPSAPAFADLHGRPLHRDKFAYNVLRPAVDEAGVPWASWHTFRHTCASMLFAQGRNIKQVQRWLGHHAASYTLDTYVHLLDGDLGSPLVLDLPQTPEASCSSPSPSPIAPSTRTPSSS